MSSKRFFAGLLIISGIVLAYLKGDSGNVQTIIYSGVALLGVGSFAESIKAKANRDIGGGEEST